MSLEQRPLGREYFYDIPIMNKTLRYDAAWKRRGGFGTEVATANVNLSLVDAQIVSLLGQSRQWGCSPLSRAHRSRSSTRILGLSFSINDEKSWDLFFHNY